MSRRLFALFLALAIGAPATAADLALVLDKPREVRIYAGADTPPRLLGRRAAIDRPVRTLPGAVPLASFPGYEALYAAYMGQFLDCGIAPDQLESRDKWVRRQTLALGNGERAWDMMALALDGDLVLVASGNGQKAVILQRATGKRLAGTACGASGALLRVSPNRRRIALVSKEISIRFPAIGGTVQWEGQFTGQQSVQLVELGAPARIAALVNTGEDVLDVQLPDQGSWQAVTAEHGASWWDPSTWLPALGGDSERRSTVRLRTYTEQGTETSVHELASKVVLVSAWFCVQPGCPGEPR
ncbi:hypothetical protein [Massilia yuzhufengensis]|uniref:Uncharacterized protein n=1 Tax=Massilia yuzhufengensis TaxID=1164594 RepID=A0A1I1P5K5_9BURK|nr:hypothetical protein [Massilia yuzhufengensis]SFD04956.1 hypothetical protein SAMN05216204_1155 [Massilia yuzhufengensis]